MFDRLEWVRLWLLRWRGRLDITPFSLFLAVALIPIGFVASVLGGQVSAAISNVLHGQIIPHAWGILLASAGLSTFIGIGRGSWLAEYVGLRLASFGLFFYSVCCYFGLGLGGIVSGTLAISYSIACWYRSRQIWRLAKADVEHKHRNQVNDA